MQSAFLIRQEEVRRRVDALPKEIEEWLKRSSSELDLNAHHSQLSAISVLMSAILEPQKAALAKLSADSPEFLNDIIALVSDIIRTQGIWDFFRDKLELRFSPEFKEALWVADSVAWNCHRPVLDEAVQHGILKAEELREPPLTYLTAEFSPATWVRFSEPNDGRNLYLGTARLPIPVIELPWDHVANTWEFLSLHHEVGHDLEADLNLQPSLQLSLQQGLAAASVPQGRIQIWRAWLGELFADLVGLQLGGPAFAESLMHLLLLPKRDVIAYRSDDPHPTHYVRILMNAAYITTLVKGDPQEPAGGPVGQVVARLAADSLSLEKRWKDIYGEPPAVLAPFLSDFSAVFKAVMDSPLTALKGKSVRELMPFKAADDNRIREAASYLRTGMSAPAPLSIPPRHCVSAARLAISAAAEAGDDLKTTLETINERTMKLVRDNTPGGLRGASASGPHKAFVASFAGLLHSHAGTP
ncbi:MAG TPA: hypothetical protein VE093_43265 [Polyangiaceae bacterium]|jgi:hypothetical protein|nr:hypothetical protein [Polyangiaceae bacterium]